MHRRPVYFATTLAAAAIVALAACSSADEAQPATTPTPSPTTSVQSTDIPEGNAENDSPPPPDATTPSLARPAGCESLPPGEVLGDEETTERVGNYWYDGLLDLGQREGANGSATFDASGQPAAYTVAEGDRPDAVAARFCIDELYLEWLNGVRMSPAWEINEPLRLAAGDTVNLNPYTITSVGDSSGVVYNNPITYYIPPQR